MKKLFVISFLAIVFSSSWVHAADPAQVIQIFGCNVAQGKTMDNVWSTMEALGAVRSDATSEDAGYSIFLWTPFRGATEYDFVFGVTSSSLIAMGQGISSYYGSAEGQASGARFADLGDCVSGIVFSEQLAEGKLGNTADRTPDAVVESFACNVKDKSDRDDVVAANSFWQAQAAKIKSAAMDTQEAFFWTPYRGAPDGIDHLYVVTYPDLTTWAQGESDYLASKEGQAAEARFNSVGTCRSNLWTGYWIVPPQEN